MRSAWEFVESRSGGLPPLPAVAIFLYSAVASAGANFWTSHGPGGGAVVSLLASSTSPPILYAQTIDGAFFNSTNEGDTWIRMNSLSDLGIHFLVIDPGASASLYASASGGVIKSRDGGLTWSSTGLTGNIAGLAISRSHPSTLYAGADSGVFKTDDGGLTWSATGLRNSGARIVIDPTNPMTAYATVGSHFLSDWLKSTDGGRNWLQLPQLKNHLGELVIEPESGTLYVSEGSCLLECGGGVSKSTDGGLSWTFIDLKTALVSLTIDPTNPATLYALTSNDPRNLMHGVLRSTNGGTNWTLINSGLPIYPGFAAYDLAIDTTSPAYLFVATENGIFRSRNGGMSWDLADSGVTNGDVTALALDPKTPSVLYAGTRGSAEGDRIGLYKSADAGRSWADLTLKGNPLSIGIDPTTPSTLYVCVYRDVRPRGVSKSTDAGVTWLTPRDGYLGELFSALVIDPHTPTTLYGAAGNRGLFKSTSGGQSWTSIAGISAYTIALAVDPIRTDVLYLGTDEGVFKSVDAGTSWNASNEGLPDSLVVSGFAISPAVPTTIYAGASAWGDCSATVPCGVWKSTDGGAHWTVTSDLPERASVLALAVDPSAPTTIYAGTSRAGVFRSTDGGLTWTGFNTGLTNKNVTTLAISPTGRTLHAGTRGGGVFDFEIIDSSRPEITPPTREPTPRRVEPRR